MRTILRDKNKHHFSFLALDLIDIKENFSNLMQIYSFLDNIIVNVIKLKQIHKPVLIPYYYGTVKQDCGISCYSFFDGGYVTFHIFEKRRLAYFDVISKKQFNVDKVIKFVSQECETCRYNIYTNNTNNMIHNKNVFGPHYIAYGTLHEDMNINQLLDLQEKIINEINMTPIINPVIVRDNKGVNLFVAIAESHISLSLSDNELRIDVFSCKMFDILKLSNMLESVMQINKKIIYTRLNKTNKL